MNSQEFELEHPQLDPLPALPLNPIDSFPSQLTFQYAPAAGIVDVLDNTLPAVEDGGFAFQAVVQPPNFDPVQDLPLHDETIPHPYHNVTNFVAREIQQVDEGWHCFTCGACNLSCYDRCSSCESCNSAENDDQSGWKCDCGKQVNAKKARCGFCQRWRGGKRKSRVKNDDHHMQSTNTLTTSREDWFCDKCEQPNAYNKVRCIACLRWKDGKRPNMKLTAPILASDLVQPSAATVASVTVAGQWICHACTAVNHKSRCRACQSWRGARRHNLPKRNNSVAKDSESTPWTCNRCNLTNDGSKVRCICQHWKNGRRLNMRATSYNEVSVDAGAPSVVPLAAAAILKPQFCNKDNTTWLCIKCSHVNESSKVRCKSCQSWTNCKQQHQIQPESAFAEATVELRMTNNNTAAWKCSGCTHTNATNSSRCESCQCDKICHDLQQSQINNPMYPHAHPVNLSEQSSASLPARASSKYNVTEAETQAIQASQHLSAPWICPHCDRKNLGSKARCGGCQKWKGQCIMPISATIQSF